MNVGVLRIRLRLPENFDLKGKRQVIKSVMARVQNKFSVAIAETDDLDSWQTATIGVVCVSNNSRHNNEVLSKVIDFIEHSRFEMELVDYEIELLPIF